MRMMASKQNLPITELPDGIRTRRLGLLRCFFNYNPFAVQVPGLEGLEVLLGSADLPPAGVLIGREESWIRQRLHLTIATALRLARKSIDEFQNSDGLANVSSKRACNIE